MTRGAPSHKSFTSAPRLQPELAAVTSAHFWKGVSSNNCGSRLSLSSLVHKSPDTVRKETRTDTHKGLEPPVFVDSTMPRVAISIIAPGQELDQELLTLDLPPGLTIADLKGFVTAETNIQPSTQQFYLNNVPLQPDSKTLEDAGVADGDMLALMTREAVSSSFNMQQARPEGSRRAGQSNEDIEHTRLRILGDPAAVAQIRAQRPALAEAINDPARFQSIWIEMLRDDADRERERHEQMRLLNEDPFNVDAQRKIEEIIRQETVQDNLHHAYEHNPELFGRVTMLYIPVEVNDRPVKAFVDSGAQTTIMSPSCAEACGIMRLIDNRYSGIAKGVGTAKILGRVHSAAIKIGSAIMPCSFTVMEGKDVDLLLGLDMLKRFQALIDLKHNKLVFGDGNEVAFLGEAEIPRQLEDALASEPTIQGPNGTEIGAESGTVQPAGTAAAASASVAGSSSFQGKGQTLGSNASTTLATRPAASAPQSSHTKQSIDRLQELGFSREEAIAALDACGGNVDYAAGLLFQG